MVDELRLLRQLFGADPLPDDPGLAEAIKARLEADVEAVTAPSAPRRSRLLLLARAEAVALRKARPGRRRDLVASAPTASPLPYRDGRGQWREPGRRGRRLRSLAVAVAVAAAALAALLVVTEGVAPSPRWALAGEISPSWRQVPGSGPRSLSLTCPSTTTCYADVPGSKGPVEVTRNGGKTWHPVATKSGTPLSNVACSSSAHCAFLEVSAIGQPVFFETADGGRTWASQPGPAKLPYAYYLTKTPFGTTERALGPMDMSCPSASTCTVVLGNQGHLGAFVTEDGGRTWSASHVPLFTPYQVQCLSGAPQCVSTGWGGASYSSDDGLHWSATKVPAFPGVRPESLSCSGWEVCTVLASSAGLSDAAGTGSPASFALFRSADAGRSWSSVEAHGLPAGEVFVGLACPSASECWMWGDAPVHLRNGGTVAGGDTGGGIVLSSANGGRTWQSTGLPKGIAGIYTLSCPSPTTCFAVASKGPAISASSSSPRAPSLALLAYTAPRR